MICDQKQNQVLKAGWNCLPHLQIKWIWPAHHAQQSIPRAPRLMNVSKKRVFIKKQSIWNHSNGEFFLKRIHLRSQVMPCPWNYSILLIHCVVSPQWSQTPAWKTPHPISLGGAKRKATAPAAMAMRLSPQDWFVWHKPPSASSGSCLRDPSWGWRWPREGRAVPLLPFPVSRVRWPSCCSPRSPHMLSADAEKLGFALPNSQALPQAAKAATP